MANPIQGLKISTNFTQVTTDFDALINHINSTLKQPFNLNINVNQIQQQMQQVVTAANNVKNSLNFNMSVSGTNGINNNLQQLDSYSERYKRVVGQAEVLNQTITKGINTTGQAVKLVDSIDEKTNKVTQTVITLTSEYEKQRQKNKSIEDSIQIQIKSLQTRAELLKQNYWTGDFTELDKFTNGLDASNIDPANYKTQLADLKNQYQSIANTVQESHRNNLASLQQEVELEDQKNASVMQNWVRQQEIDAEQRKIESDKIKNQMQTNAQLDQETTEIEKQLALYKEQLAIKNQNLQTTYGKYYDAPAMSAILNKANGLDASDFSSVSDLKDATSQLDLQVAKSTAGMQALRKESTLAMKDSDTFINTLGKDFGKMLAWSIIGTTLFGSFRALKEGIGYVNDLDNSLNQIRIVTSATQSEVEKLAASYNNLARQMSVSTKDVASTAVDLYRQGLQGTDVEERMKAIIEYAKISSISLADSNKIITATMNATGESAQKVIDIFSYLGDATA